MPLERVQRENPGVLLGGRYTPPDCTPAQTVAVIIPFRHREHHLRYWLHYLHPILRRQRLRYGVYVINQVCCLCPRLGASHQGPREPLWVWGPTCLLVHEWGWEPSWLPVCLWWCGCVNVRAGVRVCPRSHGRVCGCVKGSVHTNGARTDGCVHSLRGDEPHCLPLVGPAPWRWRPAVCWL